MTPPTQAHVILQDYEKAEGDFKHVLQVESANKAAKTQLALCRSKLKVSRDRERKIYSHMFARLADEDYE